MPSAADALFVPAAERVGIALATALVAIVAAERRHLRELGKRVLFLRWKTWAVTAPVFGFAAMGPEGAAVALVAALSFQGLREYAAMVGLPRPYRIALYAAGVASAPIAAWNLTVWRAMPPILLIGATLAPLAMQDVKEGLRHLAFAALGFAYIPWLLAYLLLIRGHVLGGNGILLAIGTAIAVSDVAAFCAGKFAGRHPLAGRVSPAKTLEGVAGSLVGAYAGFVLMSFGMPAGLDPIVRWILPAVVAAGCVWGDLVESLIKRHAGVKDAGSWLPGFGGLLDRIDSLLVVLPLTYTVLVVWG